MITMMNVTASTLWLGVAGATGLFTSIAAFFLSIAAVVLVRRLTTPDDDSKKKLAFAKALRGDVKLYATRIEANLAAKAATAPADLESLRALLRNLRYEMSEPVAYTQRMATVPVTTFPESDLSSSYGAFAGAIRALGEAIDHFYNDTTYAGSHIDRTREQYLLNQYLPEMRNIMNLSDRVKETAAKLDKLAGAYITKHSPPVKEEKPL